MLEELKKEVFQANIELVKKNLVIYTWGNVSGIDRDKGLVVIKPSGLEYSSMSFEDMVVVDLQGNIIESKYKPSTDTVTHLELYKKYHDIGGVVHTHSEWGVIFAQAGMSIPTLGTTHADYFYGDIPCTRSLTQEEVQRNYEKETGKVIIETIGDKMPLDIPGIVVKNHGPFAWGKTPNLAVHNAVVLEKVAEIAYKTIMINKEVGEVPSYLLDKHYLRKHGKNAYYGQ